MEYVDSNAINVDNVVYGKTEGEERLSHLIDKLQIDNRNINNERHNNINGFSVSATSSASLLANGIMSPTLLQEKLANGDVKTEVYLII